MFSVRAVQCRACVLLLSSGPERVKLRAVNELKGTGIHVAKPLLLWEKGQTYDKTPLSESCSRSHFLSLSLLLHSLLPPLPESLAGWKNQTANEGTALELFPYFFILQIVFTPFFHFSSSKTSASCSSSYLCLSPSLCASAI